MSLFNLIERDGCPLCGADEASIFIAFPSIPIVRCNNCGFMYSKNTLSESESSLYYRENFGSLRHLQGQIVNSKVNLTVLECLVDFRGIRTVLDVGTGYGFLLRDLGDRYENLNVVGVELSRQEAEFANAKLGQKVINSLLVDSGLAKGSYDLVTSFEVIEHISHPIDFLLELCEYVKLDGYLLIMTDNFDSRMAKALGAGFPKWIPHAHISHFSPSTLAQAIDVTKKLEIVQRVTYTPWEIFLRHAYYRIRGIDRQPSDVFDLSSVLSTEMHGTYKYFAVRSVLNRLWAKATLSKSMDGDIMYFLCRRTA